MKYKFEKYNNPEFPVYSSTQRGSGVLVVPHFHKAAELIKITSGTAQVMINTVKMQCKENDIIFIPPYSFHGATAISDETEIRGVVFELNMINQNVPGISIERILNKERITEYIIAEKAGSACTHVASEVSLTSHLANGFQRKFLYSEKAGSACTHVASEVSLTSHLANKNHRNLLYSELDICFQNIVRVYTEREFTYEIDILSHLYKLVSLLIRVYHTSPTADYSADYGRMIPVIEYMNKNYHKKIYVSDLSKILHVCDDHLIRLFKSVTNKSPLQYLVDLRIEEAMKILISTTLSVSEISNRVGFSNQNYMAGLFKSKFGMTPGEYRKKLGESGV